MNNTNVRRRINSATVYVPFAVLLIMVFTGLGISVFLRIIEIEVIGATIYPGEEVINASGIMVGDGLLFIDRDAATTSIMAAMPYINEVRIEYRIPDLVRIFVVEAVATAKIDYEGNTYAIDSDGRALEQIASNSLSLIEVRGFSPVGVSVGSRLRVESGDDTRFRYLIDMLRAIESEGILDLVSVIDVTNIAYVSFVYDNLYTVIVGTPENVASKLVRLPEIVAEVVVDNDSNELMNIYMTDREPWRVAPNR